MSRAQAEHVEGLLRNGPLDLGGDLTVQRPLLERLMTSHPLPSGVIAEPGRLGEVPVVHVLPAETVDDGIILYFHGGAYSLGSARAGAGLAAELVARTGRDALSVEYRLAPEAPFPAAYDDAAAAYQAVLDELDASRVVIVGESAGGGLALALLQHIRDEQLPSPAAAILFSPWADLSGTAGTITSHADVDPVLTGAALDTRAADYAGNTPLIDPRVSPVFGSFEGLPPLLVQVGSHEILLDDAIAVAAAAARAHVDVTLDVTPHVPHVFQGFAADLGEGDAALSAAAAFITNQLSKKDP